MAFPIDDAELLERHPEASVADPALRAYALADARDRIDGDAYPADARAHGLLAMHFLASSPSSGVTSGSTVTSRRAGEIAVTSAAPSSAGSTGLHSETAYGRLFDQEFAHAVVVGLVG